MSSRSPSSPPNLRPVSLEPLAGLALQPPVLRVRSRDAGPTGRAISSGPAASNSSPPWIRPAPTRPQRLQTSVVSGHKADFGLMLLDPNPLRIDAVHQRLMARSLGPALRPTYSFVSMTEVSEYVPTVEQYAQKLLQQGEAPDSPAFKAKVKAYEAPAARHESAAADARVPAVAGHVLLSDEQEAQGRRELVHACRSPPATA